MRRKIRRRDRKVLMGVLAVALPLASVALLPAPAFSAGVPSPTLVGPVLTQPESSTVSDLTDAGITVPLPNGTDLWVFGDLVRYQYGKGAWKQHGFIFGSNAAEGPYSQGQLPAPLDNVKVGKSVSATNQPAQFIPAPTDVYMKNGSGKLCTKANGARYQARWATGAALMPDSTNVLVTYIDGCIVSGSSYTAEGWGFMEYNWSENTISVPPFDVFPPPTNGATLPETENFGSPVVTNNTVTLFSGSACPDDYYTTVAANTASLENPGSYALSHTGWGATGCGTVAQTFGPGLRPELQLLWFTSPSVGQFEVDSAPTASGPWTKEASGTLPGCSNTSLGPNGLSCYATQLHPELSSPSQLLMSYVLPDYGPGVAGHPDSTLGHLVVASVSLTAGSSPLYIESSPLSNGAFGQAYSATLRAAGGVAPYTWSISRGALPGGLTLDPSTGVISGDPTSGGTFDFTVQATDSTVRTAETAAASLSITIKVPLGITTGALPGATVGQSYSATLGATGGTSPYKWKKSGKLPKGLRLNPSGTISGTPSAKAVSETFKVSVTDKSHPKQSATATFTIVVS